MGHPVCDALRDLVANVKFKKREKHKWRSVTFSQPATLPSNTSPWVFFTLNCENANKFRKASHMFEFNNQITRIRWLQPSC